MSDISSSQGEDSNEIQTDKYSKVENINLDSVFDSNKLNEDQEIVIFELPKTFNKKSLNGLKIKKIKQGKEIKLGSKHRGIVSEIKDSNKYLVTQKNRRCSFKPISKIIKVYEKMEDQLYSTENILSRKVIKH